MKRLFAVILCVPSVLSYAQNGMGVGNNNPQELLDVSGAIKIGGTLQGAADAGSIRWNGTNFQGYDGTQWVNLDSQGGADSDWTVSGSNQYSAVSGNVGIGTASPTAKLDLDGQMRMRTGATAGYVPVSDANGVMTWTDPNTIVSGDNLGDHTATENVQLNGYWLSNDGGNEGVRIANDGNVGIGTGTPGAKLEVAGQVKITGGTPGANKVLTSDASGLASWVDPNTLVSDGDWTVSGSDQYSAVTGNVGIGTNSPMSKLEINGNQRFTKGSNRIIEVADATINGESGNDLSIEAGSASSTGGSAGDGGNLILIAGDQRDGALNNADGSNVEVHAGSNNWPGGSLDTDEGEIRFFTNATERLQIQANGNIGIGTTLPTAKLDVVGTVAMNDNQLRLRGGADGNHFLSYIGGSFDGAKLTGNNNVILNTMTGGDALIVTGSRVGIGTASPIAPLHVEAQANANYGNFTYYAFQANAGGGSCCGGTVNGVSIHASGRMMASEFDAFSDARIKNVIQVSDSKQDLEKLLGIEITDYRMKDAAKDVKPYKKVIAQQVETVYPEAVSTITDVIPNIYTVSTIEEGYIALATELKVGNRVKLIFDDGVEMANVVDVDDSGFKVDVIRTSDVFVYGQEVSDFRTVDYEAISMLNVSATQELFKMISALQSENDEMRAEISGLQNLRKEMESLKTWLNYQGEANNR